MASILLFLAILILSCTFVVWLGLFLLDLALNTSRAVGDEWRRQIWFRIGFGASVLITDIILFIVFFLIDQLPAMVLPG